VLARQHRLFGGTYGAGKRMPIVHTRALLRGALDGRLGTAPAR
jgi:ATP-dependent phosphoenolpyruvate carboxykinase